jgi:chitinase
MKLLRDARWKVPVVLIAIGLAAGITGGTFAAFSATTANGGNSFGVKADYEAPAVVRSEIARTTATAGGRIKASAAYYVYAQITDGGNPASGVNTTNANVCNVTTASCASVALASGAYTVSGLAYNYRSASTTSDAGLTAGSKTYTVTAVDVATNSSGAVSFSVVGDNTVPAGSDIQTANTSGGTVGKAEAGDTATFTFTEAMDPGSILAAWTGSSTSVTVTITNGGCAANDSISVNGVNLGAPCLGGATYVATTRTFASSTMVLNAARTVVTVTLGTPSGATGTQASNTSTTWAPSASALDIAGNACSAAVVTESGAADKEF